MQPRNEHLTHSFVHRILPKVKATPITIRRTHSTIVLQYAINSNIEKYNSFCNIVANYIAHICTVNKQSTIANLNKYIQIIEYKQCTLYLL